jgi:hypothetical protein
MATIVLHHLGNHLAYMQGLKRLHIRISLKEQNPLNQPIGMLHFLDGFHPPFPGKILDSPIIQQPIMQPVLVYGGKLMTQRLVEIVDNLWITPHGHISRRLLCLPVQRAASAESPDPAQPPGINPQNNTPSIPQEDERLREKISVPRKSPCQHSCCPHTAQKLGDENPLALAHLM